MKRRITAVILGICLLLIQAVPLGVFASETPDWSDYVAPTERTDNLIANNEDINLYKAVNSKVVTVDAGETSSEANFTYIGDGSGNGKWDNFSYYGTEGTWAKSTGGGYGQTSGFNGYYPKGPESFVVEMQIRNAAPDKNANPEFTFSVFTDRAEGVAEKQIVPVTETENWQTVKTVFHTDKESPSSMWITLGYGGTSSKVYPAIGTTVALNKPSLYVAIERAHEITLTSDSSLLLPGNSMELKAHVVNQLGIEGNLTQDFTWTALNSDRSAVVDGFSFAEGEDGAVTVTAADSVPAGKYVILASHNSELSVKNGVRKGIEIVVPPYFMHDSEFGTDPLYEVKLTADTDTTLGIFDKLNITAALVDSNGDKGTNEQSFDWYVLNEERTEKLSDSGVNLVLSGEGSVSAEVGLDIDVAEGTYCIVAESKAEESKGMLKGLKITVDKSGVVSDIAESIGEDSVAETENNIETYMQILEITDDYVVKSDKNEFAAILKDGISKETIEDKADMQDYFRRAALTALFNIPIGDVALFDEKGFHNYDEELRIDKIDSKDLGTTLYEGAMSEMSDAGKTAYRASLTGKDFATYGDLYDTICENLLLLTIANPKDEGTAYLDTVITKSNLALFDITADEYFALNETEFKSFKKTYLEKKTFDINTLASTLKLAADYKLDDGNIEKEEEKQGGNKVSFGGGNGGGSNKKDESDTADEETDVSEKTDMLDREFTDVPATHWARAEIHFLKNIGVVNGITDTSYMPDAFVTREQFLKLIIEAFDLGTSDAEITFQDVKSDAWYSAYVMTGVEKGIINGQSNTQFGIGKSITREDACVMLDRALNLSADKSEDVSFEDSDKISDYAKDAVAALASYGIISGVGDGEFNPEGICTRAQAAKIIAGTINVCNSLGIGR